MTETALKIESLEDLRKVLVIAQGGDPEAIQAVANFMDLKSNTERSYFPDKIATLCVGQLNGFGKVYFPQEDWDPFTLVANSIAVAFMGYKGFKSSQFVDMTRQTPNLDALKTAAEDTKQNFVSRILGRSHE